MHRDKVSRFQIINTGYTMENGLLHRTERLLGKDIVARIQSRKVIIFGVGGVGSWCAESLVRSGIKYLTIVDNDVVSDTNVNRQLMATSSTVGRVKVEALKERLLDINPEAEITALHRVYDEETADSFQIEQYDYIIDCIDSLKDKALLIENANKIESAVFYSSMGAALKIDPTRIQVGEFGKVRGCPLGAALRKKMRRNKTYPKKKFLCVFSDELLENKGETDETCDYKAVINGSLAHITAIFGFTIAGLLLQDINRV